jgi:hypothetical protein
MKDIRLTAFALALWLLGGALLSAQEPRPQPVRSVHVVIVDAGRGADPVEGAAVTLAELSGDEHHGLTDKAGRIDFVTTVDATLTSLSVLHEGSPYGSARM